MLPSNNMACGGPLNTIANTSDFKLHAPTTAQQPQAQHSAPHHPPNTISAAWASIPTPAEVPLPPGPKTTDFKNLVATIGHIGRNVTLLQPSEIATSAEYTWIGPATRANLDTEVNAAWGIVNSPDLMILPEQRKWAQNRLVAITRQIRMQERKERLRTWFSKVL
jgi:hypothetical protein